MSTNSYPSKQDVARTIVLHYVGKNIKRARREVEKGNYTLRGVLIGSDSILDSLVMQEATLRYLDNFSRNANVYSRNDEDVAAVLNEMIQSILDESGDGQMLRDVNVEISVITYAIPGYSDKLQARFFPAS